MAQLVDLERLETTVLSGVSVVAISPDGPDAIRKGLAAVEKERGVRLTHAFLADEKARFAPRYGWVEPSAPGAPRPPTILLLDGFGRDVWHAGESHYQKRSFEEPLRQALARLRQDTSIP